MILSGFPKHFLERMEERKITPSQIVEILQSGKRKFDLSQKSVAYIYKGICLISSADSRAVTVYRKKQESGEKNDSRTSNNRFRRKKEALRRFDDLKMIQDAFAGHPAVI